MKMTPNQKLALNAIRKRLRELKSVDVRRGVQGDEICRYSKLSARRMWQAVAGVEKLGLVMVVNHDWGSEVYLNPNSSSARGRGKKTSEQIDDLVNHAMLQAGGGGPVSVLRTAHVLKNDKTFLKLLGLKNSYESVRTKDGLRDGFWKIRGTVRASMERMYGPLQPVC